MLSLVVLVRPRSPRLSDAGGIFTDFSSSLSSLVNPRFSPLRRLAATGILSPISRQLPRPGATNDEEKGRFRDSHHQRIIRWRHDSIRRHARWLLLPLVGAIDQSYHQTLISRWHQQ